MVTYKPRYNYTAVFATGHVVTQEKGRLTGDFEENGNNAVVFATMVPTTIPPGNSRVGKLVCFLFYTPGIAESEHDEKRK